MSEGRLFGSSNIDASELVTAGDSPTIDTLRCQITRNPCGTDTWAVGKPCRCGHCRLYCVALDLRSQLAAAQAEIAKLKESHRG